MRINFGSRNGKGRRESHCCDTGRVGPASALLDLDLEITAADAVSSLWSTGSRKTRKGREKMSPPSPSRVEFEFTVPVPKGVGKGRKSYTSDIWERREGGKSD
jgi:hypothetical protein